MSFEQKYLKYKEKYLNLIKQTGGNIIINGNTYLLNTKYEFNSSNQDYDDIGKMNINGLGFSDNYPKLYFEVINWNVYPVRHTLTIHEITDDFKLPDSIFNKFLSLTHDQISEFKIKDGTVHSEKFEKLFKNIFVDIHYSDVKFVNFKLTKK